MAVASSIFHKLWLLFVKCVRLRFNRILRFLHFIAVEYPVYPVPYGVLGAFRSIFLVELLRCRHIAMVGEQWENTWGGRVDIEWKRRHTLSCLWILSNEKNYIKKKSSECWMLGFVQLWEFFLFTYYIDIITRHFGHTSRWCVPPSTRIRTFQHQHHTHFAAASAARTDCERVSKPIWVEWNCYIRFVHISLSFSFWPTTATQLKYFFCHHQTWMKRIEWSVRRFTILFARVSFIIWLYIYSVFAVRFTAQDHVRESQRIPTATTTWSIWLRCCLRLRMIWKVR